MGEIMNMTYNKTIDSLVTGINNRLDNPFYRYTDKSPTITTFYNINEEATTFDEATINTYDQVSPQSGLRFNKIENVLLYGIPKIELDIDQGEWGTESTPIEGECILPPNTFKPLQNSYFVINYLETGKVIFFKVIKVNQDTLPNGANCWQIGYKLDLFNAEIDKQVVKTFKMVSGNIGTALKSVVEETTYDLAYKIEDVCNTLQTYYKDLFFKANVQTFVYKYRSDDGSYFYDPFMIEFLIKNKVMRGKKYEFIYHQTYKAPSFNIDYDMTIFKAVESNNPNIDCPRAYAVLIDDPMSLMSVRLEDYYAITYTDIDGERISTLLCDPIDTIDNDLISNIKNHIYFADEDNRAYMNIIIACIYGEDLTDKLIDSLYKVRYIPCKELFYMIPIIIYCLDRYNKELFKIANKKSKL